MSTFGAFYFLLHVISLTLQSETGIIISSSEKANGFKLIQERSSEVRNVRYVRLMTALVLMLALTFGWSVAAFAATPGDVEIDDPAAPVSSFVGGSSALTGVSAESSVTDPAGTSGGAALTVLPDTGGSLLFLSALGGLALIGGGLHLLRHSGAR